MRQLTRCCQFPRGAVTNNVSRTNGGGRNPLAHEMHCDILYKERNSQRNRDVQSIVQKSFYEPSEFHWLRSVDCQFDKIRDELVSFSTANPVYQSYVEPIGKTTAGGFWDVASLVFFSINNPALIEMAPHTASVISAIPGLVTMQILDLGPNTHLRAHCGYSPDTLRFHLGIVVPEPEKYVLRVDKEYGHWEEGKWLIFDDYLEHEVWNRGEQSRKVLLIDAVRPGVEFTPQEVARRFFENAPGTNFDGLLSKVASREQWLEWVEHGEFR